INGDPDQPIVTGTVYNGTNPSPFDGKESSEGFTKSGIKTCSIPDGDKGHELIFEDKKDAEKITLSSTKDFELLVENDSKFMIKKNSHGEIEEGDATFEIKKGNKKVTLKEGNYTINVVKGELTIETEKNISIKAKGDILLESEKNIDMKAKSISLKAENDIKLKADNSYSTEAQNIKLNSSLATEIKASTSLKITGGASANIKAPTVAIASDTTFEMKGAIGKIEASGPLEIKGAITKLN
ncbi:MAG: hypothetical protein K2X69_11595, partial [Silvanigrellaceae bacterium]|nr:hypothetical protein [Silvanigrellaceae bacterium]